MGEKSKVSGHVKVVMRRLPRNLTEVELREQISPIPAEVTEVRFVPADPAFHPYAYCACYLTFSQYCDALIGFEQRFNGYIFVDSKGVDSMAVVEAATNQSIAPKDADAVRKDARRNTITDEPHYKEYVKKLADDEAQPYLKIEQQLKLLSAGESTHTKIDQIETPLVKFMMERELERRKVDVRRRGKRETERRKFDEFMSKKRNEPVPKPTARPLLETNLNRTTQPTSTSATSADWIRLLTAGKLEVKHANATRGEVKGARSVRIDLSKPASLANRRIDDQDREKVVKKDRRERNEAAPSRPKRAEGGATGKDGAAAKKEKDSRREKREAKNKEKPAGQPKKNPPSKYSRRGLAADEL